MSFFPSKSQEKSSSHRFLQDKSQKQLKGVCFFDFDLRLEWLFHSSKEKVFDKMYGFKLLRGTDTCELHCSNEDHLKELTHILNRKLNLLNFHTHYKAIKKIGKGNFASVTEKPLFSIFI